MALAPVIYTLWQRFLRFDPNDPNWLNRDRFVLSNGHASMLLYAMLHLTGVKAVDSKYERLGEFAVTRQLNGRRATCSCLKTAKAMNLTVPNTVAALVDEVIE